MSSKVYCEFDLKGDNVRENVTSVVYCMPHIREHHGLLLLYQRYIFIYFACRQVILWELKSYNLFRDIERIRYNILLSETANKQTMGRVVLTVANIK